MCGIVGIYNHQEPVAAVLHDSLIHLQHRGQDAAGILTCDSRFYLKQGLGLVREIFTPADIGTLKGKIGIAHTRYPTAGGYSTSDIQPLWIGSPRGIALAHNGNITNYQELADRIRNKQYRHLNSSLDSEVLLLLLADQLAKYDMSVHVAHDEAHFFQQLCAAVENLHQILTGSYAVVGIVIGKGLVAFRDPHGIRPLAYGERLREDGHKDYIFASETTAFYSLGFEHKGDLQPGEVAFVSQEGILYRQQLKRKTFSPCVFEYVYFARPDSTLDGVSVYRSRLRMGQNLAKLWKARHPHLLPDVVIPAPFTANTAALSFAHELGVRYSEGLYKNPFIGRTFIMPNQQKRSHSVRHKLTPQRTEIENKDVLILDDSIVRGTTSKEIVKMVREYGAKSIYLVATSPPIKYPCYYGIDIPSSKELIAANLSNAEIAAYIGVDQLLYQELNDLNEAVLRRGHHNIDQPCTACMDGKYICGKMTDENKMKWEAVRYEDKKNSEATK